MPARSRRIALAAVAGAVAIASLAGAAVLSRSDPPPEPHDGGGRGIYWGAAIGDHLTGTQAPWDMGAVESFEGAAGKELSLIHMSTPLANCEEECWYYGFPAEQLEKIREYGAIPLLSWASQSIPPTLDQPEFQLSDLLEGDHDPQIREFAAGAADWGHPFFLRFNWEMNGDWFAWSEDANGNRPGEYVAAWHHVHEIFAAAGAGNATWIWCPDSDPDREHRDMATLYPGDDYVDWTCLDGYNWGTNPAKPDRWRNFDEIFGEAYRYVAKTIAPTKPLMIGEFASTEVGGSRVEWLDEALPSIPRDYPRVRAIAWFEKYDDGMDWPIAVSASSAEAFARGIDHPAYRPNEFGNIEASPIPPPG